MKVLVACEESQEVCKAFRALGHEAYSCDIQECSGGHPEWHIQGDCMKVIDPDIWITSRYPTIHDEMWGNFQTQDGNTHELPPLWDLIIAHPPCTYLSNAGARWLFKGGKLNEERYAKGKTAKQFFIRLLSARCDHICIENPIPSSVYRLPQYTQVIQPYEYGHPYSKKTCLWLKGLPRLKPTCIIDEHTPFISSGTYSKTHDPRYKGASRKGGSAKSRSKTFSGIAWAMAEQWSAYIEHGEEQAQSCRRRYCDS